MAKKKEGLFTKAALEKLSSPEQLDVMMEVTKPAGWVALGAVGFLLAVVILWSIFGSIPSTVDGQGILIRGVALVDVEAKTEGSIRELLVKVGDEVEINQPIATVSQGGLAVQIKTLEDEIAQKKQEYGAAEAQASFSISKQVGSLESNIESLNLRLKSQQTALEEARDAVAKARESRSRGLTTQAKVDAEIARTRAIQDTILSLDQQLKSIPGQIAALQNQLDTSVRAHLLELSQLQRDLENKIRSMNSATQILSVATGRVIELRLRPGATVSSKSVVVSLEPFDRKETPVGKVVGLPSTQAGTVVNIIDEGRFVEEGGPVALVRENGEDHVITAAKAGKVEKVLFAVEDTVEKGAVLVHLQPMAVEITPATLQAVIYVPAGEGKHITQKDTVRISPSTVKAEEYGFMLGTVTSISGYPVTPQGMLETLKNQALVQEFSGESAPLEVTAELQVVSDNVSGYAWSSGEGPPIGIQGGTKCTVQIVVDERAPISYVLPILKSATGL
ncbi:MAG: NHLP bacteriocin system secretion protein [Verrucomicrobiae bacterium]|nr:NHLP bacteriocin system secretion protein [Verrucomicrobiae bacterium]